MIAIPHPVARLFVEANLSAGEAIDLTGKLAHYLSHVMRLTEGGYVALFNGRDGEWLAEAETVGKRELRLRCRDRRREQTASPDHWLLFAPVKGDRVDGIVEKATELGIGTLAPIRTARTVIGRVNDARLRSTMIEAAEQCERLDLPRLHPYRPLEAWLGEWDPARRLILCDETGQGTPPDAALSPLQGSPVALLVGPEGGFASQELERLRGLPYVVPMTLGPRVLRADTAAIAALTCVQLFLGDWEKKPSFRAAPHDG